jgi:hypothetical protein
LALELELLPSLSIGCSWRSPVTSGCVNVERRLAGRVDKAKAPVISVHAAASSLARAPFRVDRRCSQGPIGDSVDEATVACAPRCANTNGLTDPEGHHVALPPADTDDLAVAPYRQRRLDIISGNEEPATRQIGEYGINLVESWEHGKVRTCQAR